jgi:A/G-specific adenine glycosylase
VSLLAWYERNARSLPWRDDATPYGVLLSELMLQQTRVATVLPYYRRFLARWPTLADLAAADEQDVLSEWAGLGYYSRARNLHRAAQAAMALGGLPDTAVALRKLPGIGPYTAGAVASIAFGRAEPAVDGNVERVISRVAGIEDDPKRAVGKRAIAAEVQRRQPPDRPGDFNQALMELGATVCSPRTPRCPVCPLVGECVAYATHRQEQLPKRTPKAPPKRVFGATAVVTDAAGRVLLGRRPHPGLLAKMWEPWSVPVELPDHARAALASSLLDLGIEVAFERRLPDVVHVFSHRHLTSTVFAVRHIKGLPTGLGGYSAVDFVAEPFGVPMSKLAHKLLQAR